MTSASGPPASARPATRRRRTDPSSSCYQSRCLVGGLEGHGIYNAGALTVNGSRISDNGIAGDLGSSGGGIYNIGMLTLTGSEVTGNLVGNAAIPSSARGGGIYNDGTATVKSTSVTGNTSDNCAPSGSVTGCVG